MANTMWDASVPVFRQGLIRLKDIVQQARYESRGWNHETQLIFEHEVREATEHALGAGRVAAVEVPALPAIEGSFDNMVWRIDETIKFVEGLGSELLYNKEHASITITVDDQELTLPVQTYLYDFAIPNFYFHFVTASNIVRPNPGDTPFKPKPDEPLPLIPGTSRPEEPTKSTPRTTPDSARR
jgi:hypothetical protein